MSEKPRVKDPCGDCIEQPYYPNCDPNCPCPFVDVEDNEEDAYDE
jgi:hypothetical protein